MSAKVLGQIWDYIVDGDERLVLQALADRCEHDGTAARPSINRVAWMTDFKVRKVQRVLHRLRTAADCTIDGCAVDHLGVLEVTQPSAYRRPTEYRIVLARLSRKLPFRDQEKGVSGDTHEVDEKGVGGDTLDPRAKGVKTTVMGVTGGEKGVKTDPKGAALSTKARPYSSTDSSTDSSTNSSARTCSHDRRWYGVGPGDDTARCQKCPRVAVAS